MMSQAGNDGPDRGMDQVHGSDQVRTRLSNMKRISLIATLWIVACANSPGQTNPPPVARPTFSVSTSVRQLAPESGTASSSPVAEPDTGLDRKAATSAPDKSVEAADLLSRRGSLAEVMTSSTASSDPGLRLYRRLEQGGNLKLLEPTLRSESGGIVEVIFQPEVIHLGKTSFSCTIVTAYKRKNPLCLLNPIFLNVSW